MRDVKPQHSRGLRQQVKYRSDIFIIIYFKELSHDSLTCDLFGNKYFPHSDVDRKKNRERERKSLNPAEKRRKTKIVTFHKVLGVPSVCISYSRRE